MPYFTVGAAAAKSLQSCPTLCDPIDGSPPGSPVPGILQARTLAWVAIAFSNASKWSRSVVSDSSRPHGLQPTRLLHPWDFPGKSTRVGCHCLLPQLALNGYNFFKPSDKYVKNLVMVNMFPWQISVSWEWLFNVLYSLVLLHDVVWTSPDRSFWSLMSTEMP